MSLETIEGYDIIEKIGEGGMGQVFRAVHRRLDRPVAIKRLAPHLSQNQDMLRRFLQEARLQARLTHPNVVNIFDLIENDQGIFLVMEYVEGQTARDMLLGRGRLSVPEALMIAEGVLSGLAFMHKNGVVHRDIKPSNIMVSVSGTVKVTDFGIARLVNEETGLTRFGGGIGTLHYMAPELIKSGEVSFSIDIYSLGATLHELLSGAPPFIGNTDLEIMMGHLEKEPPVLSLPEDGEAANLCRTLVATALAKLPADRFPSAEAFLAEVRRIRELVQKSQPAPELTPPVTPPAPPKTRTPAPALDRPTTPAPVSPAAAPVAEQATSIAQLPQPAAKAQDAPAPPKPAPAPEAAASGPARPGRRGLWIGLAAAGVAGLALFLALRPGSETPPPAPAPTQTSAQATTPPPVAPAPAPMPESVPTAAPAAVPDVPAPSPPVQPASEPTPTAVQDVPAPPKAQDVPAAPAVQAEPAAPQPEPQTASPAAPAAPDTPAQQTAQQAAPPEEAPAAPAPDAPQRIVYVKTGDARLREKADTASAVLTALDPGTRLIVLENSGEWIRVSAPDGRTGYILDRLTASSPPAPPAAQAPARAAKPAPRRPQKPAGEDQGWKIVK
jgi:serine/threonine-protein kinase